MSLSPSKPQESIARTTRDWASAAFSDGRSASDQAPRLMVVHEDVAGDTKVGRCAAGGPLRLGERTYERGIGVNSHSVLRVFVGEPAREFRAVIGLDRNVDGTAGSVRFRVAIDGRDVYASAVFRAGDRPTPISVALNGARSFDLIVDDGGDGRGWDQADWVEPIVALENGKEIRLDTVARSARVEPGLPISFVYGGRPSSEFPHRWRREASVARKDDVEVREIVLTDPETGLQVQATARIMLDAAGADWTVRFRNTGSADTPPIESICPLDLSVQTGIGGHVAVEKLRGSAQGALSWQPVREELRAGAAERLASANGRTAGLIGPFFTVDWGAGGAVVGIGWSGQWQADIERPQPSHLVVRAGYQGVRVCLRPGEEIRSPRILLVIYADADPERGRQAFRRTMLAHVWPKAANRPVVPPIAHLSTSFYEMNDSTEENVLSHLNSVRGLGFEVFWLDAYWTRGGFPEGMGNYALPLSRVEPEDRFPRGLRPIAEAVRNAGMGFLLWFEPERVAQGTAIAREHPEWVLSPAGDGSGLFNLGVPEAREYMRRYLSEAIRAYGLSWLRIDFNIEPLAFWRHGDHGDPDRAGMTEIRYVEGLYRLWDDLRQEYPHLAIDNCASGGTRIDLETCSRSVPLWRTDDTIGPLMEQDFNEAAMRNQIMTVGLTRYVPYSVSGQMGAAPYLFRSGLNGGIAFCEDVRREDYPREDLRRAIAEAKRLRPYFAGDFTAHAGADADPTDWCVLQWHRSERDDGMVMAFRRHGSPFSAYDASLDSINANGLYTVRISPGYARGKPTTMRGRDLARLRIAIPERPGSVVIEYARRVE